MIETHKNLKDIPRMSMNWKLRLSSMAFTTWLMVIIAFMLLLQTFNLEVFYVMTLIGLFVVVVMIDTSQVKPRYMRRMKYVVATAIMIFGYVVANRLVEIVAQ